MRAYVVTDIEGAAGVSRWEQGGRDGDTPAKQAAMRLLTAEVNACVDGILDAVPGAEVVIWDGHGNGAIVFEDLHPRARLIARGPISAPYLLDRGFDALYFVGQHAMAGTPGATLCHTYSSKTVEYFRLNGVPMGEFGCRAAMAGELGIPTVFVSGDDKAVAEAKALLPGIVGVAVKEGLGLELALHLPVVEARARIREGAAEAIRRAGEIPPVMVAPPYELEVRYLAGQAAPPRLAGNARLVDDRTVVYSAPHTWELPI